MTRRTSNPPASELPRATAADFEAVERIFVAQEHRPAQLKPVALTALSRFQRALLVIDGTVTQFIEAYAAESVDVIRLAQQEIVLDAANEWLALPAATTAIRRRVQLRGRSSGETYAWAESWIAPQRLDGPLRAALEVAGGGLGQLMIDGRLETRREVLWCGRQRVETVPFTLPGCTDEELLTRSYRVHARGAPLMLITEWFPLRSPVPA